MKLTMAGVQMEMGAALQEHTREKLTDLATYVDEIIEAHAALRHDAHHSHLHHAEVSVQVQGLRLAAEGQGIDHYAAVDEAIGKLRRQLERYKGRVRQHRARHAAHKTETLMAEEQVLVLPEENDQDPLVVEAETTYAAYVPVVTKKQVTTIAPMRVDDAVMQMDLLHKPAFMFLNADTGQMNMVYREEGQAVRWVAPKG